MKPYSTFYLVCTDRGLTDLRQKTDILSNGWKSNSTVLNRNWENDCATGETWYGYTGGDSVGAIYTTFQGVGEAYLSYGCCYQIGIVKVLLNGKIISEASNFQRKDVEFRYETGDELTIAEYKTSIWKLYSLSLFNCN